MKTAAIICEYNPLHLGHTRQWKAIRARFGGETAILCLMSGNYVQRGAPAVFRKDLRARAAVDCGADLVLELPLTCALRSAEGFAAGGVGILDRLGCADVLCFGSETGETAPLWAAAERLRAPEFAGVLKEELAGGSAFAAARAAAFARLGGDAELLRRPNDILGVEYCKALQALGSAIEPAAFPRPGDHHAARLDPDQPSAAALRQRIEGEEPWEDCVPPAAQDALACAAPHALGWGERAVLARLRALPDEAFEALPGGGEGLWRRFRRACREEETVEDILAAVKSKRYAYTRLTRMLLCAFLDLTAQDLAQEPPYVRVLSFSARGQGLLRQLRDRAGIPVVNAGETPPDAAYYALEQRAAILYPLFAAPDSPAPCMREGAYRIYQRK